MVLGLVLRPMHWCGNHEKEGKKTKGQDQQDLDQYEGSYENGLENYQETPSKAGSNGFASPAGEVQVAFGPLTEGDLLQPRDTPEPRI